MEESNSYSGQDNLSKCSNCNDAPGDFILDSCLHSICNYCVATCLELRDIYNCPKCFIKSRISANIFLPILGKQPVKNCNWCEVGNETNWAAGHCNECDAHLCPECIKGHCRMPQFRSHYVTLMKDESVVGKTLRNCDSHPNEALDIYCETCEKLTCRDCQLSLHKEHKHQWIGEKAKEMETSLSSLRSKLGEKLSEISDLSSSVVANRDSLAGNVKLARLDLHNYIEQFQQCQQTFFDRLEQDLNEEATNREHKLAEIGHEINRARESMEHCTNLLNKISSANEPSILIQVTPKLLKYINLIIDRLETDNNSFQPFLDLEYCETRFVSSKSPSEILEQIGQTKFGNSIDNSTAAAATFKNEANLPINDSNNQSPEMDEAEELCQLEEDRDRRRCFCSVCAEPGVVVCCSACELLFHAACHVPRLSQLPAGADWVCTSCLNPRRFVLEPADRSLPHKGRLNKKERKVVARIFLEMLQFNDWSIFVNEDSNNTAKTNNNTANNNNNNGNTIINNSNNLLDLEKVRFNIENKIYTSIDKFISDLREIFQQTEEKYPNSRVSRKVARFQNRLNSLLQKYIPSEVVMQY